MLHIIPFVTPPYGSSEAYLATLVSRCSKTWFHSQRLLQRSMWRRSATNGISISLPWAAIEGSSAFLRGRYALGGLHTTESTVSRFTTTSSVFYLEEDVYNSYVDILSVNSSSI